MKRKNSTKGSNLIFCIILVALLGILAGAYALMLSHNTNASVSQRKFQQEYLTADSLRQSVVDSILSGKNTQIKNFEGQIQALTADYLDYVASWDKLSAAEKAEREKANDTPAYRLEILKHRTLTSTGTTTLDDGAAITITLTYKIGDRDLNLIADYKGKENYTLGAVLHAEGDGSADPAITGNGIHLGDDQIMSLWYLSDFTPAVLSSGLDHDNRVLKFDARYDDVYCLPYNFYTAEWSYVLDVSRIKITGTHRVFIAFPSGSKIFLTGTNDSSELDQLYLVTYNTGLGIPSRLIIYNGFNFYGHIYMPDALLYLNRNGNSSEALWNGTGFSASINGTLTLSPDNTTLDGLAFRKNPPAAIHVTEEDGDFSGTGVDSLGPYWGSAGSASASGGIADLSKWEVQSYYEG